MNKKIKWLPLYLYSNCFNDNNSTHLGFKYRGSFYCITHNNSNIDKKIKNWIQGIEIPKKCLKMAKISQKKEYLKPCISIPTILHKTNMYIDFEFVKIYTKLI